MSRKLVLDIYEAFADQFKLKYKSPLLEDDLKALAKLLNSSDPQIYELVSSYESAVQSVSFFEKEKEMRIKFPDIWKMQLQQAKDSKEAIKNRIIELGEKHSTNIGQIFQYHKNKKLSLDDFSQID